MIEIHGHKINFNDKQIKQKLQKVLIAEIEVLLARKEDEIAWQENYKRGLLTLYGDIFIGIDWKTLSVGYMGRGD